MVRPGGVLPLKKVVYVRAKQKNENRNVVELTWFNVFIYTWFIYQMYACQLLCGFNLTIGLIELTAICMKFDFVKVPPRLDA